MDFLKKGLRLESITSVQFAGQSGELVLQVAYPGYKPGQWSPLTLSPKATQELLYLVDKLSRSREFLQVAGDGSPSGETH